MEQRRNSLENTCSHAVAKSTNSEAFCSGSARATRKARTRWLCALRLAFLSGVAACRRDKVKCHYSAGAEAHCLTNGVSGILGCTSIHKRVHLPSEQGTSLESTEVKRRDSPLYPAQTKIFTWPARSAPQPRSLRAGSHNRAERGKVRRTLQRGIQGNLARRSHGAVLRPGTCAPYPRTRGARDGTSRGHLGRCRH